MNNYDNDIYDTVAYRIHSIRLNKLKSGKGEVVLTMDTYDQAREMARKTYLYLKDLLECTIRECALDISQEDNEIIAEELQDDKDKFQQQLEGIILSGKREQEFLKNNTHDKKKTKIKQKKSKVKKAR